MKFKVIFALGLLFMVGGAQADIHSERIEKAARHLNVTMDKFLSKIKSFDEPNRPFFHRLNKISRHMSRAGFELESEAKMAKPSHHRLRRLCDEMNTAHRFWHETYVVGEEKLKNDPHKEIRSIFRVGLKLRERARDTDEACRGF